MDEEGTGPSNPQESSPRRSKTHQNDDSEANPDRLSELPESLIVQILSLLPTEEAVRTGVLSTRWKNHWNHIDKLDFMYDIEEPSPGALESFISFVDRTLMQCNSPKIQKFSLLAFLFHEDFDHKVLDRWLQWVCSRNVECIQVEVPGISYTNPEWFYHNSSLVKLRIFDCNVTILGNVRWTSLRSLTLSYVTAEDDQIAKILWDCPVLENLILFEVTNFRRLNIMSLSLVKLTVVNFEEIAIQGLLEINAPGLKFLNLSGYFYGVVIRIIDVSLLVHANINIRHCPNPFAHENADDLLLNAATKLLRSVHHVEELTFGPELIQFRIILDPESEDQVSQPEENVGVISEDVHQLKLQIEEFMREMREQCAAQEASQAGGRPSPTASTAHAPINGAVGRGERCDHPCGRRRVREHQMARYDWPFQHHPSLEEHEQTHQAVKVVRPDICMDPVCLIE
ncbi:hypothetical protein BUALT_Bualt19G0053600 [Buddleja alternifolia]|uniref:F-box domain-containing protein n=1 Tax=Buddleja alternifolia TaxID=168488 RepID=A0AAV6W7N0_9LAMI|nr:hypothetical protein BUALT_Bualt19G0053600 [Buddleja alternifolia]